MNEDLRDNVYAYFENDINENRNIYFKKFKSSKEFKEENVTKILEGLGDICKEDLNTIHESGFEVRKEQSPIILWKIEESIWLIVYSSSLSQSTRKSIDKLSNKVGWILDEYFDNDTIDKLYNEFSPDNDSVNIERKWDPYWLYQNSSDIPDEFLEYYQDNIRKFVEQEIEFNLKTPKWLVDDTLEQRVDGELLEKSDISKTRFTFLSQRSDIRQDGGVQVDPPESGVTVRQEGQIVHRRGDPDATFEMIDIIDDEESPEVPFESIFDETEYDKYESGIIDIKNHGKNRLLKLLFPKKDFDKESSITLSNLFTVGQSDVDLHGVIKGRDGLEFLSETYTAYDNGKYEIFLTGEQGNPCLYIQPISGTPESLEYIYKKISQKFDSRIDATITDDVIEGDIN